MGTANSVEGLESSKGRLKKIFSYFQKLPKTKDYDIVFDINSIDRGNRGPKKLPNGEKILVGGWPVYVSKKFLQKMKEAYQNPQKGGKIEMIKNFVFSGCGEKGKEQKKEDQGRKDRIRNVFDEIGSIANNKTTVGVLGLFDRGKTWLINQLGNTSLPSSKKIATKGLSFLLPEPGLIDLSNVLFLDSAGTNVPVEDTLKDETLAWKKAVEELLRDLVFDISDILIIVVNEITWSDQEYITGILKKLEAGFKTSSKVFKDLIIVHNYHDVTNTDTLIKVFKKNVTSKFTGGSMRKSKVPNSEAGIYYYTENTKHFFMAKEGSPAGKKWNNRTVHMIQESLRTSVLCKTDNLLEVIKSTLTRHLASYCKTPIKIDYAWNGEMDYVDLESLDNDSMDETGQVETFDKKEKKELSKLQDIIKFLQNTEKEKEDEIFPFVLYSKTKLELVHSKVKYDGYHCFLVKDKGKFVPTVDTIQSSDACYVVFECPGFLKDFSNSVQKKVQKKVQQKDVTDGRISKDSEGSNDSLNFGLDITLVREKNSALKFIQLIGDMKKYFIDRAGKPIAYNTTQTVEQERKYGRFERKVQIPIGFTSHGMKVFIRNGIGSIMLPKEEEESKVVINF